MSATSHDISLDLPTAPKERSLDIAQRFEKKLAEYNSSQSIFKRWLFEGMSWLASAVSMAAIIVIYLCIRDTPVSSGAIYLIWTNALGKIASAALILPTSEALGQLKWNWFHESKAMWDFEIFDKASRGPWGALMLLFRTKGRSLAALGALLIVLLLAIDTFFQQVIDLSEVWTLQSGAGVLPLAQWYGPDLAKLYMSGVQMSVDDKDALYVIEKFSFGNGTQPVPYGNGTRFDVPLVRTRSTRRRSTADRTSLPTSLPVSVPANFVSTSPAQQATVHGRCMTLWAFAPSVRISPAISASSASMRVSIGRRT